MKVQQLIKSLRNKHDIACDIAADLLISYMKTSLERYQEIETLINDNQQLGKELEAYRIAEQDGTLLRLPCKVGDMVFVDKRTLFERWRTKGVSEDIATGEVVSFRKNKTSTFVKIKFYFKEGSRTYFENYVLSAFGKTVFLTLEAAEAALKEQEGNDGK